MSRIRTIEILKPGPPGDLTQAVADARYADKDAPITVQQDGVTVDTPDTINVRGSAKQAVDFSGITHFFIPPTLDVRAYGMVEGTGLTTQQRDDNTTALQAAVTDASGSAHGTRTVLIPGDFNDVYEFNDTIAYGSGVHLSNLMRSANYGARLHYYGAVDTNAFEPTAAGRSGFVVSGVRLEDKRGNSTNTGTGEGFNCDQVFNGTIFEDVTVVGFYRNITANQNDMIRITGGWQLFAHQFAIYLNAVTNFNSIRDLAFEVENAEGPTQAAAIYVNGGGVDSHLLIQEIKLEGDVSTCDGIVLNGTIPFTEIDGFSARGGSAIRDVVRIVSAQADGQGEEAVLRRVASRYNSATNLLRVIHTNPNPDEEFTIPVSTTTGHITVINEWSAKHRSLGFRAMPGTNANYDWNTTASWGNNAPGDIELWASGAGSGATVDIDGDDMTGTITLTTGTSAGVAQLFDFNYRVPWPRTPKGVELTPVNAAAAADIAKVYPDSTVSNLTKNHWRLQARAALTDSTEYKWSYRVLP